MDDTIAAIATSVGISALNIIKVSGNDSIKIVSKLFSGKDLSKVESHTIHYGFIMDKNEKIDEVLVSVFKSPKSYTTEDVVEINCHGGITSTNKILELLLLNGARLAEPGEFLKRAFLNGRVDLIEAESVQDLINSKTEKSRKMSIKGIDGELSKLINNLREDLLSVIANIEVNIDYPEYEDALLVTNKVLKEKTKSIKEKLQKILKQSENGKIIKNGIKVGIVGKPNVGKSSILNKLLNEDKAIVTNIEGTTRDIVEGTILLNGIELHLVDTAGIRKTTDEVESIGVTKSYKIIEDADLLLIILDNSKEINNEDKTILEKIDKNKSIVVINKIDLNNNLDKTLLKGLKVVETSVETGEGFENLKEYIISMFNLKSLDDNDYTYLSNARQISLVKQCIETLKEIEKEIKDDIEVDLIETDIRILWDKLGEITGQSYRDELLDEIFSKFCLGK